MTVHARRRATVLAAVLAALVLVGAAVPARTLGMAVLAVAGAAYTVALVRDL